MIAVDSSTVVAFLENEAGPDVELFAKAMGTGSVVLPPAAQAELFSHAELDAISRKLILGLPLLPVLDGFWIRAGELRKALIAKKRRARLGDSLIAQACIDANVSLITRDNDFHAFALAAGLNLSP